MDMRNHARSGSIAAAAAAALVWLSVVGCGGSSDELPRKGISGSVKLDGTRFLQAWSLSPVLHP